MLSYLQLVEHVLDNGLPRPNRTGERAIGIFGWMLEHDMRSHFPLLSTKKMSIDPIFAELKGFIMGASSAAEFREYGTKIWDANANQNQAWVANKFRVGDDDLGRIYGVQWRSWLSVRDEAGIQTVSQTDQLAKLIEGIQNDPFGRRHIVTAWNPGELGQMALPPCHVLFQVYVNADEKGEPVGISMNMYQRSVDLFLGLPFNIASYALLLRMIGKITRLVPMNLKLMLGDVHIYESHIPEMLIQSRRLPSSSKTTLSFAERTDEYTSLEQFVREDFEITGYWPQGALKGKMAV